MESYARFYASFNELPYGGDREEFKKSIVAQFTWNRTTSLKEMTEEEYRACCATLEKMSGRKDRIRRERSCCLRLMQRMGVNTSDWSAVDGFCMNPRIAGKRFSHIGLEELAALQKKLRAIERNGGLKKRKPQPTTAESGDPTAGNGGNLVMVHIPDVTGEA